MVPRQLRESDREGSGSFEQHFLFASTTPQISSQEAAIPTREAKRDIPLSLTKLGGLRTIPDQYTAS